MQPNPVVPDLQPAPPGSLVARRPVGRVVGDLPTAPLVVGSISLRGRNALQDAMIDAFASLGQGADAIELRFPGGSLTSLERADAVDQLGASCSAPIFVRAGDLMAPSGQRVILPWSAGAPRRPIDDAVYDLGIDELGVASSSPAVGDRWRDSDSVGAFSVSTVGFDPLDAGELIALATIACVRGATAIITDRVRSVRRVVDTVTPVMAAAREALAPVIADATASALDQRKTDVH